ncbi:MAG: flagellar hook-basal body complex protein FliE [Vicinamibacterales bacterium]
MAITPISTPTPVSSLAPSTNAAAAAGPGFGDALKQLLATVDGTTATANTAVSNMLGGTGDVHEAMIALHRAEMTMQLTVQVRNKLVAAYQDVMRMPI